MNFTLPKAVTIDGQEYGIRYDYRVILEILIMLEDPELKKEEKAAALLVMFYTEPEQIQNVEKAVAECYAFIDQGHTGSKGPRTMDWEQDFDYIVTPVNRVIGEDVRGINYDPETNTGGLHWWTFLSAYMEIGGDCLFAQIVNIRGKLARGEKLEKHERKWMNQNRSIVSLRRKYSESEDEALKAWIQGGET